MNDSILALIIIILGSGVGGFFAYRKWNKDKKKIMAEFEQAKINDPLINPPPEYLKNKGKKEVIINVRQEKEIEILRRAVRGEYDEEFNKGSTPKHGQLGSGGFGGADFGDDLKQAFTLEQGLGRIEERERISDQSTNPSPEQKGFGRRSDVQIQPSNAVSQSDSRNKGRFQFRRRGA